jgi:hypothetical protein
MPRVHIKHTCDTSAFISHVFATWRQVRISTNLREILRWRMCMCTQMLCCSHSIVTGAQLLCSCILLFVLLMSGVLALVCQRGEKKKLCMDEGFCVTAKRSDWLQDSSDKCNSAPYPSIIRPFVSLVTYMLRTRTPSTLISCQPNSFTLCEHPVLPATKTKNERKWIFILHNLLLL